METAIDHAGTEGTESTRVTVFLKWSRQVFQFDIDIPTPTDHVDIENPPEKYTGQTFKEVVYSITQVPIERQKLLPAKPKPSSRTIKLWKGILKDDFDFSKALEDAPDGDQSFELGVTLMGTAEVLAPLTDTNRTRFIEDMTPAEKRAEERRELADSMANVVAMIPALQFPPRDRQPLKKGNVSPDRTLDIVSDFEETRVYNRLVHGYSQLRIDALLRNQNPERRYLQEEQMAPGKVKDNIGDVVGISIPAVPPQLLGRPVMTLGLEVQRAYVNDLAVLSEDGTLVSGLDDGHVQMWKHCHKMQDIVHQSAGGIGVFDAFPGVDSVLALDNDRGSSKAAFATAGRGCIRVWNRDGEPLLGRSSPLPYASPTGLVRVPFGVDGTNPDEENFLCLAARFRTAPPPSRRPRLVPQDEAGRRRIEEIDHTESLVNADLHKLSKSVQILFVDTSKRTPPTGTGNETIGTNSSASAIPTLRSLFLKMPHPVTSMESWKDYNSHMLVVGDNLGGITFVKLAMAAPGESMSRSDHASEIPRLLWSKLRYLKIASLQDPTESESAIVCMKYVSETRQLFVSTRQIDPTPLSIDTLDDSATSEDVESTIFPLKPAQGVHCISVDAVLNNFNNDPLDFTLDGHRDVVHSILPLPNGDLVTAGGKHDATTKVWSREQLRGAAPRTRVNERVRGYDGQADAMAVLESSPPPVLTEAATANLCKDAGYVFATELLEDFKSKGNRSDPSQPHGGNPFALAVARYNVVKIVI